MKREPWEEAPHIWKSKSEYFTWVRGAIRRIWSDYPLRKDWKKKALRPVTTQEKHDKKFHPSTRNVGECVFCKEWLPGSKLQVDHKLVSNGCTSKETAEEFLWHCAGTIGSDYQLVCVPCHKIKNYQESRGITFEKARTEKEVIAFAKLPLTQQLKRLQLLDVELTKQTKKECKEKYREYLNSKERK